MNSKLIVNNLSKTTEFSGVIKVSGAKNAALPELAAALLSEEQIILKEVPYLADIASMITVIASMGAEVKLSADRELTINAKNMVKLVPPAHWVQKIRASILLLGPLLARNGYAKISMPGGCAIGLRPILEHISGLEALGAIVKIEKNIITAETEGLKGAHIKMNSVSVGATENLMMAAVLAEGTTIIDNAACEPEVMDLAKMLNKMGAKITGFGTNKLTIIGVSALGSATHAVMPDRIEAGTLLIAATATRGKITLNNCPVDALGSVLSNLKLAGARIIASNDSISLTMDNKQPKSVSVSTAVYPGFPTDLQAQWVVLSAVSNGQAIVQETIFDDRFNHIPELLKMGAKIRQNGNSLTIDGIPLLQPSEVFATDLRAAAGLAIAGMLTTGQTHIVNAHYLDRGYDNFEQKLRACGVVLSREADYELKDVN